jgi:CRP-like cAMP-binding protein
MPELASGATTHADAWRTVVGRRGSTGYPAGIELFQQGGTLDSVYFVAHGLVKLTDIQSDGRVTILGLRSRGWIVGAAAAIRRHPYPVTATTLTRCQLFRVGVRRFLTSLQRSAGLSWYVHDMHARELHDQLAQEVGLRSLTARERLEHFLATLLPQRGSAARPVEFRLELPLRLWEVAQLIAVTPAYLSDLLGQLETEGVVRRSKGTVTITRPDRLSSPASGV